YFKVLQAGGPGPIGGYGLLVNFGNQYQAPIQPPNTVVPQQPDQGGGVTNNALIQGSGAGGGATDLRSIGALQASAVSYTVGRFAAWGLLATTSAPTDRGSSLVASATASASTWPTIQTATTQITPAAVTLGTASSILQVVDDALDLENWTPISTKKASA
ncbi:MAG: hypothetical protein ACLQVF_19795, partial [Isosphaeraceae bacterium]